MLVGLETAVFEITKDESHFRQEFRAWRRHLKGRNLGRVLRILLEILIAGFMIVGAAVRAPELFFPMSFLLALLVVAPWLDRWWMSRQAQESQRFGYTSRIEISDSGLRETDLWNDGTVDWTVFTSARRERKGIMLYLDPNAFKWLPFDALVEGTPEDVEGIIQRNIPNYRGR